MSLFASTAGIMTEIVIGMKSFVFIVLAIIAGVMIINLMSVDTLRQQWSYVKIGKMNIYGNKNGAAEKPETFGQHRLFNSIVL